MSVFVDQSQGPIKFSSLNYTADARIIMRNYHPEDDRLSVITALDHPLTRDQELLFEGKKIMKSIRSRIGRKGINGINVKSPYVLPSGIIGIELDLICPVEEYRKKVPNWNEAFQCDTRTGKFWMYGKEVPPDGIKLALEQGKKDMLNQILPYIKVDKMVRIGKDGLLYVPLSPKKFVPSDDYTLDILVDILNNAKGREKIQNYREEIAWDMIVQPKRGVITQIDYETNFQSNVESADVHGVHNFLSSYTRDGEGKLVIELYNTTNQPQTVREIGIRFFYPNAVPPNRFFRDKARRNGRLELSSA